VNQGTNNAQGNTMVVCPNCGASDSTENAVRETGEYLMNKLMRERLPEVNNPGIAVTHSVARSFRFIVD
jgi:hypothetical protein